MGKHDSGYARVDKDLYQTLSPWVVDALAEHIEIRGKTIWEPAAGDGYLSDRLLAAGAAWSTRLIDSIMPDSTSRSTFSR